MGRLKINVEKRPGLGKQAVKRLRSEGHIPAVIYGKGINAPVSISSESFKVLKNIHFSESVVIDLTIDGQKKSDSLPVLIKDVQSHPLTSEVIHLDLIKVSLKEKIKVHIPVVLKGEAKGKEEGAVLEQILREIEVEGLPLDIPENLEVDISGLEIGHSIHLKELQFPGDIKIVSDPEATVATLGIKKEEEPEPEEELIDEEAPAEPEVIKEKKQEDKEEAEQPEKKPKGTQPEKKPEEDREKK